MIYSYISEAEVFVRNLLVHFKKNLRRGFPTKADESHSINTVQQILEDHKEWGWINYMFYQAYLGFETADSPLYNIQSHISQFGFLLMLGMRMYMKKFSSQHL